MDRRSDPQGGDLGPFDAIAPIDLALLDASAALRRRFDSKFLISADMVHAFAMSLGPEWRVLEVDGRRQVTYRSQYYDDSLRCFSDHIKGRRLRFKVRVRQYLPDPKTILEIKLKTGRGLTDKHRRVRPEFAPIDLLPDEFTWLGARLNESGVQPDVAELAPSVCVWFVRTTLLHTPSGERITVDENLVASTGEESISLIPGACVLEVKSAAARALSTRLILTQFRCRPTSFSKYCAAVEAVNPDGNHRMLKDARRTISRQGGTTR